MESNSSKVRLHKDGLIANDIHLVIKKWIINQRDISMIISDNTTVFASLRNVIGSKDTTQCRKLLGLNDNVDLAMIFIITMCSTRFVDKQVVTNWIGSDLQESSIKIIIRGELTPELKDVGIGSVCAILNPNMKEQMIASELKSITIGQMDDILVIGQLDGLIACKGITSKGEMCKNLVYTHNQGDYCKYHIKFANKKENNRVNRASNNMSKKGNSDENKKDFNSKLLEARLGERAYFEGGKTYTLVERTKPSKPHETIAKLGDLNFLMQKIIKDRTVSSLSTTSTKTEETNSRVIGVNNQTNQVPNIEGANSNQPAKTNETVNSNNFKETKANSKSGSNQITKSKVDMDTAQEFERLTNLIKQYVSKDSREYNNILNTLQLMVNKVSGVSNDVIKKTQVMKMCDFLLDHPLENVAITALRLRRTIRKYKKSSLKDGEYTVTRTNSGKVNERLDYISAPNNVMNSTKPGDNRSNQTPNRGQNKQTILNELDSLINLSSKVEPIVDKEKGIKLTEKLKNIEKMDRTEEFKLTIKFVEVQAYHCRECSMWFEHVNNYCKREKHTLTKKRVKKEYHVCMNKQCSYRYYSLNGQKPSRCPKCKQTTVLSQKTSFYKPRPDYLMPNEKLMESDPGKSRPLDCNS